VTAGADTDVAVPQPEPAPVSVQASFALGDSYRTAMWEWTVDKTYDGSGTVSIPRDVTEVLSFTVIADYAYDTTALMISPYSTLTIANDGDETLTGVSVRFTLQGLASDGTWIEIDVPEYMIDPPVSTTLAPGESTTAACDAMGTYIEEVGTPAALANVTEVRMLYTVSWDGGQSSGVIEPDAPLQIYDEPTGTLYDYGHQATEGLQVVPLTQESYPVEGRTEASFEFALTNLGASGSGFFYNIAALVPDRIGDMATGYAMVFIDAGPAA